MSKSIFLIVAVLGLVAGCSGMPKNYYEQEHDGRIYVMGSEESSCEFMENKHLPYARTLIGEGPGGKTVVIEIDKDDEQLADRLEKLFKARHGGT